MVYAVVGGRIINQASREAFAYSSTSWWVPSSWEKQLSNSTFMKMAHYLPSHKTLD